MSTKPARQQLPGGQTSSPAGEGGMLWRFSQQWEVCLHSFQGNEITLDRSCQLLLVSHRRGAFSSKSCQSLQRSMWPLREIFFKNPSSARLHHSSECCCLTWHSQDDVVPLPGGKQTWYWQDLPANLGQQRCRGIITPEQNENFWTLEHSMRQFFLSQGNYWRSKHYYGWRRWENEKRGRGGGCIV